VNLIGVFTPHALGILGGILWVSAVIRLTDHRTMLTAVISLLFYAMLFLTLVGLAPSAWLHAKPTEDQEADTAIILGFGYEADDEGMKPGAANRALLKWVVDNRSTQVRVILVQEGGWVATDRGTMRQLGIDVRRIHQHDPHIYVNTLDTAYCVMQELRRLDKNKALLIAHDLQLGRVALDFERVSKKICPDCTFVIPDIHSMPYPANSVHWHTRNEFVYKIVEVLVARPRDFLSPIPTECKAPLKSD
jgi:hypothetical protein